MPTKEIVLPSGEVRRRAVSAESVAAEQAARQERSRDAVIRALADYHKSVEDLETAGQAREKCLVDKEIALHSEDIPDEEITTKALAVDRAANIFYERESAKDKAFSTLERATVDFHREYSESQIDFMARWREIIRSAVVKAARWVGDPNDGLSRQTIDKVFCFAEPTVAISALAPGPLTVGRRSSRGDYSAEVVAQARELLDKYANLVQWQPKL